MCRAAHPSAGAHLVHIGAQPGLDGVAIVILPEFVLGQIGAPGDEQGVRKSTSDNDVGLAPVSVPAVDIFFSICHVGAMVPLMTSFRNLDSRPLRLCEARDSREHRRWDRLVTTHRDHGIRATMFVESAR